MMDIEYLYNRNPMLILSYVTKHEGQSPELTVSKISDKLGLSIGSVYEILKKFNDMELVTGLKIGHAIIYGPKRENPLIRHFRIFDNLLSLAGLVRQLKHYSRKIILFGSCSRGDDTIESDIDLFILADDDMQSLIRNIISEYRLDRELKPVIVNSIEFIEMQNSDRVFYEEIQKGFILWGEE
jgi:predicted nucleotidyltransferase